MDQGTLFPETEGRDVVFLNDIQVVRLFTSEGHNFFGHHGRGPGQHLIREHKEIECVAGRGIRGDRFFDYKPDYRGQITFFAQEVFDRVTYELGLHGRAPSLVRRNVITAGHDLNALIGKVFVVQGIRFLGTAECKPCYWMDEALCPGAETALKGNGGLRAKILTGGVLRRTAG